MKRVSLFFTGVVLSMFFMTSCFKGAGNQVDIPIIGILQFSEKTPSLVLKTNLGNFHNANLSQLSDMMGDCFYTWVRIDYDDPVNAEAVVQNNGFYTVTFLDNVYQLPKYYTKPFITDTETVLDQEYPVTKAVTDAVNDWTYLDDYFIVQHLVTQNTSLKLNWEMSYENTGQPTLENGRRYYDLYLRATIKEGDKENAYTDVPYLNVYKMNSYFTNAASNEKLELGSSYNATTSKFSVRLNYVSALDTT